MSERQSTPSRVVGAVSQGTKRAVLQSPFIVVPGLVLIGVWVVFIGAALAVILFTERSPVIPWWVHLPGVAGVAMAAPGTLGRIATAWKDLK